MRNSQDTTTKFLNNYNITYERVKEAFLNELEADENINIDINKNKVKVQLLMKKVRLMKMKII